MKVLVTGAKGQVGSEVVLAFQEAGHEVIAYGSRDLDITQENLVAQAFKEHQDCQFIINCAAYTAVDKAESEADKAYAINALGVKHLAMHANTYKIPVVHLSTDYIFDGEKPGAYEESDPGNPQNVYGKTKFQGEEFLKAFCSEHIILRVSWVFGRFGHNFVKTMLRLLAERAELNVVDDQRGCPTEAKDLAGVILKICEHNQVSAKWGVYHYCGTPVTTWYGFASKIYELANGAIFNNACMLKPIPTSAYPTPAKRPKNSELATHKISNDFNIKPTAWESSLKLVLAELRKS